MRIKKNLILFFHSAQRWMPMEWEKAVPCGEGSGQAHPTAARDLRRLRPCLADAAGRI